MILKSKIESEQPSFKSNQVLGIDVGGTGIKAAIVDVDKGIIISERIKYPTPKPASVPAIVKILNQLLEKHNWTNKKFGLALPGVIKNNLVLTAPNLAADWVNLPYPQYFFNHLSKADIKVLNDADAAALAELHFGAIRNISGLTLMLTIGTGIGSSFIYQKNIIPNIEVGHLEILNQPAEKHAAKSIKEKNNWNYEIWTQKLNLVIKEYEKLFHPDLIVIGGSISKKASKWIPLLNTSTPILAAKYCNHAGIIGSALAASLV